MNISDETTIVCSPEHSDAVGRMMAWTIKWAGEQLKFKVPLEGEPKVGSTWKEIH